ncbi:MAG: hypothetical protein CMN30_31260 [Sandaracinus sp.]|nr:hypothetical protein [Sandaracinus sp.]|tara:strand:+ start:450 stop:1100 length:651 start_codon:yes stop_codon:yes gene_type:complete
MRYLLDANVFIQGKNRAYGFDICPGFWEWLESDRAAGRVCSIEKVQDELTTGDDELATWAGRQSEEFFLPMDPSVIAAFTAVSSWVKAQPQYGQAAANTFFEAADYYLVAYAHAHGDVVVTHETPAPQAKKVKLPTACIGVGVKTMNPWEMLRREKVRFVLEQPVAERPQPGGAEGQAEVAPRVPQDDTSGVAAFFGTWPGDESDAELLEALGETK